MSKATDTQVNGSHYAERAIQPIEYIHANELDFLSGNIVKYATRWPYKGQALSDLQKVIHYAQLLIELEGLEEPTAGCESSLNCGTCTCNDETACAWVDPFDGPWYVTDGLKFTQQKETR